jgi:hypothetical protein
MNPGIQIPHSPSERLIASSLSSGTAGFALGHPRNKEREAAPGEVAHPEPEEADRKRDERGGLEGKGRREQVHRILPLELQVASTHFEAREPLMLP